MREKFKIRKGDKVIVLTGKDKGKIGEVTKTLPKERRLIVGGINKIVKHVKPSRTSAGGRIVTEAPLAISNVAMLDPKLQVPTKVGFKLLDDGKKVRFAKKSGEVIDQQ